MGITIHHRHDFGLTPSTQPMFLSVFVLVLALSLVVYNRRRK
jgi:hypothetical protein